MQAQSDETIAIDVEGQSAKAEGHVSTKRALAFVYVGYAFRYLYLLILIPFYGRVLGTAEYGRVVAAMSLFQVVWMLTEYGFPSIGSRAIAIANETERAALYARHVLARSAMAVVGIAVGVGGTVLSPLLREVPVMGLLATLTGVVAGFNMGWFFQGTLRFRTSVSLEILGFILNLSMILPLVRGPHDGWLVMFALAVSSVICTVCAHVLVLRALPRHALRWGGALMLVRESTALFVHRGLVSLVGAASTYLISLFASASELGLYGAAERLISAGLSLMAPANQVLVGTVSQRIGEHDGGEGAFVLVRKALSGMVSLGICMFVGTELLGDVIVPLILGESFAGSVPIVRIMAIMFPFAAVNQVITGYVLIPFRFDRFVPLVSGATSMVTLALIYLLGRSFAGPGVAWARVIGDVLTVGLLMVVLQKTQLSARLFTQRAAVR